jgi:hypothetical protein
VVPNAIRSTWNNFDSEWHTLSLEVRREAQSRTPLLRRRAAQKTQLQKQMHPGELQRDGGRDRRRPISVTKSNGVEKNEDKETAQESLMISPMRPRRKREPASKRKRVTFRAAATDQAENRTQACRRATGSASDNTRRSRKNGETRC